MKTCPYCSADNRDDAAACYFCGNRLPVTPPDSTEPTQPLHTRPRPALRPYGDTQVMSPYRPNHQQPPPTQPLQQPLPTYPSAPGARGPVPSAGANRFWRVFVAGLVIVLLCAGGMAAWTLVSAGAQGAASLRAQVATRAAGIFPGLPATQPASTPVPPDQPAPDASATQAAVVAKLLTPACASALDQLGGMSGRVSGQPQILLDSTWRAGFTQALDGMKSSCGTLDTASPIPGEVSQVQRDLSQASSEYDQARQLWTDGTQAGDLGKIWEAAGHIGTATQHLNQAIAGLKKIMP